MVPPAPVVQKTVRGRPEPQVRRQDPVFPVVPGPPVGGTIATRPEKVGNFVLAVAVAAQVGRGQSKQIRGEPFVRELNRTVFDPCGHGRARCDRQVVAGQVIRSQLDGPGHIRPPPPPGLAGDPIDQVQPHIVKAGRPSPAQGVDALSDLVNPAQKRQDAIVAGLQPNVDPVDADLPVVDQLFAINGARVDFQGYFDIRRHPKTDVHRFKDPGDLVGLQDGWRPAPKIDAVHVKIPLPAHGQFCQQRLDIRGDQTKVAKGVKIAIGTFGAAERHMDVQPCQCRGGRRWG